MTSLRLWPLPTLVVLVLLSACARPGGRSSNNGDDDDDSVAADVFTGWVDGQDDTVGMFECTGDLTVWVGADAMSDGEFTCDGVDDDSPTFDATWSQRRLPTNNDPILFSGGGEGDFTAGFAAELIIGVASYDFDCECVLGTVPFSFNFEASGE